MLIGWKKGRKREESRKKYTRKKRYEGRKKRTKGGRKPRITKERRAQECREGWGKRKGEREREKRERRNTFSLSFLP